MSSQVDALRRPASSGGWLTWALLIFFLLALGGALGTAYAQPAWGTVALLGVAAAVVLFTAVYLAVGLFQARSLVRREFTAYFVSPIAYVVLVVFLAITGHLFAFTYDLLTTTGPRGTEYPMLTMFAPQPTLSVSPGTVYWLVFLFIPPLLTMRLFAEERSTGTLEVLMTAPLQDWQIVLSKYVACLAFYVVLWLPTLLYLPALQGASLPVYQPNWDQSAVLMTSGAGACLLGLLMLLPRFGTGLRLFSVLLVLGGLGLAIGAGVWHYKQGTPGDRLLTVPVLLDPFPVLTTYLGMFLAGAMFLAIGLFVSSLVRQQMVAALLSLALGLVFIVFGFLRPEQDGSLLYRAVYFFSVPLHFEQAFTRGILDTRPVVLYVSATVFCLFLTVRSLEGRRWQ